jgi:ribosomal protein S18 acetylase RimI-like enzyme
MAKPINDMSNNDRQVSLPAAVFRPAAIGDAPALSVFAERSFRETFAHDNKPEDMNQYCREAFGLEIQQRELTDPEVMTLLALSETTIVGYGQIRLGSGTTCIACDNAAEIRRLYVGSTWQGKQIARELLRKLVGAATHSGAKCIWLGVWERNARAIRFYEKAGFSVVGEHEFSLGSDIQRDLILKLARGSSEAAA